MPIVNLIFSELQNANQKAKSHQTKFSRHRSGVDRTHKTIHEKITRGFLPQNRTKHGLGCQKIRDLVEVSSLFPHRNWVGNLTANGDLTTKTGARKPRETSTNVETYGPRHGPLCGNSQLSRGPMGEERWHLGCQEKP